MTTGPSLSSADSYFDVVLIGPRGVGKTAVSERISRETGRGVFHVDEHCHRFYLQDSTFRQIALLLGSDGSHETLAPIFKELGRRLGPDCLGYQEKLHLLAVRQALTTVREPILDLGSGHGSFVLEFNQNNLREMLALQPVVCLWPSQDFVRSVRILHERNDRNRLETESALRNHKGRQIARQVIYTEDDGVEVVASRVIEWMTKPQPYRRASPR